MSLIVLKWYLLLTTIMNMIGIIVGLIKFENSNDRLILIQMLIVYFIPLLYFITLMI